MEFRKTSQRLLICSRTRLFRHRYNVHVLGSTSVISSDTATQSSGNFQLFRHYHQNRRDNYWTVIQPHYKRIQILSERRHGSTYGIQYKWFGSVAEKIQRDPSFSMINSDDINYFKEIIGDKNVIQDEDKLLNANTDWMRKYQGSSKLLLQPRSSEEVSQILKYCNSRCLAVVPQGGNTSLVGGSVPLFDEVIVTLASLNNVISFDKVSGVLVCEAGCILENLVSFLDNEG